MNLDRQRSWQSRGEPSGYASRMEQGFEEPLKGKGKDQHVGTVATSKKELFGG